MRDASSRRRRRLHASLGCTLVHAPVVIYTVRHKTCRFIFTITSTNIILFPFSRRKYRKLELNLPPHLKSVATLPCKISVLLLLRHLVSSARYCDLFRKSRNFYTPRLYFAFPRRNLLKVFDADKTRMIGLP